MEVEALDGQVRVMIGQCCIHHVSHGFSRCAGGIRIRVVREILPHVADLQQVVGIPGVVTDQPAEPLVGL